MSKREILGGAVRAIREAKAALPATADHSPANFIGARFASTCQMSPGHLCNIEKGRKKSTPLETIYRIAFALGVSIDAISYEVPNADSQQVAA